MATLLSASATGCSNIISAVITDSYVASTGTATIVCTNTNRGIGDSIEVSLQGTKMFEGYVKNIDLQESERVYTITAANVLIRAVDYFLASTNPDAPFTRSSIKLEALVGALMAEAGLTSFTGQNSGFTLGVINPVEVNLTSAYDYSKFLASLVAFSLYADKNGTVHLDDTKPYPNGGGSVATLTKANSVSMNYSKSDRDLRNRVVVYGAPGIYAEAKASSPYLPAGFYKSIVIATPVLDTMSLANQTANYNLSLFNRLTRRVTVSTVGNTNIQCRDDITVNNSDLGLSDTVMVYSVEHNWSKTGYLTNIEGRLS